MHKSNWLSLNTLFNNVKSQSSHLEVWINADFIPTAGDCLCKTTAVLHKLWWEKRCSEDPKGVNTSRSNLCVEVLPYRRMYRSIDHSLLEGRPSVIFQTWSVRTQCGLVAPSRLGCQESQGLSGVTGQGLAARAFPTTSARSRATLEMMKSCFLVRKSDKWSKWGNLLIGNPFDAA